MQQEAQQFLTALNCYFSVAILRRLRTKHTAQMIFSSDFPELSNYQPPRLCCKTHSKTPNTHLFCASHGNQEEKSWKAVEEQNFSD